MCVETGSYFHVSFITMSRKYALLTDVALKQGNDTVLFSRTQSESFIPNSRSGCKPGNTVSFLFEIKDLRSWNLK